jgi:hypothetical protein
MMNTSKQYNSNAVSNHEKRFKLDLETDFDMLKTRRPKKQKASGKSSLAKSVRVSGRTLPSEKKKKLMTSQVKRDNYHKKFLLAKKDKVRHERVNHRQRVADRDAKWFVDKSEDISLLDIMPQPIQGQTAVVPKDEDLESEIDYDLKTDYDFYIEPHILLSLIHI